MAGSIMQEIREKVARLEAAFESDGRNTKETLSRISDTQDKMLGVIQEIAGTQREMKHIGDIIDKHDIKIELLSKTQERHKVVVAIAVFVSCAIFTAVVGWVVP